MPRYTIHLVRHGRVDNPNHVVYADLPGFDLDPSGVLDAHEAARYLSTHPVAAVVTSPLARARHTATAIARHHDLEPIADRRLIEWNMSEKWRGRRWEELPDIAPGELDQYLSDPTDLPFATESIDTLVTRLRSVVAERAVDSGETVFVAHQDPIAAAILALTDGSLTDLRSSPPDHGSVISLTGDGSTWHVSDVWQPLPR